MPTINYYCCLCGNATECHLTGREAAQFQIELHCPNCGKQPHQLAKTGKAGIAANWNGTTIYPPEVEVREKP